MSRGEVGRRGSTFIIGRREERDTEFVVLVRWTADNGQWTPGGHD